MTMPLPEELVRHSLLARLPAAPLGHRFALPAAQAAEPLSQSAASEIASARNDRTLFLGLGKGGGH